MHHIRGTGRTNEDVGAFQLEFLSDREYVIIFQKFCLLMVWRLLLLSQTSSQTARSMHEDGTYRLARFVPHRYIELVEFRNESYVQLPQQGKHNTNLRHRCVHNKQCYGGLSLHNPATCSPDSTLSDASIG